MTNQTVLSNSLLKIYRCFIIKKDQETLESSSFFLATGFSNNQTRILSNQHVHLIQRNKFLEKLNILDLSANEKN